MVLLCDMDDIALKNRAMAAYFRGQDTRLIDQPNQHESGVEQHNEKTYVVLRTGGKALAVYRLRNDGILRRMKRPPKSIE